eukprot:2930859-Rhodomonas_salina.1
MVKQTGLDCPCLAWNSPASGQLPHTLDGNHCIYTAHTRKLDVGQFATWVQCSRSSLSRQSQSLTCVLERPLYTEA